MLSHLSPFEPLRSTAGGELLELCCSMGCASGVQRQVPRNELPRRAPYASSGTAVMLCLLNLVGWPH